MAGSATDKILKVNIYGFGQKTCTWLEVRERNGICKN